MLNKKCLYKEWVESADFIASMDSMSSVSVVGAGNVVQIQKVDTSGTIGYYES